MPLTRTSPPVVEDPVAPVEDADDGALALALQSPDVQARRAAVRLLTRRGAVAQLIAQLSAEADPTVRGAILTGVVQCNNPAAAAPLLDLLRSEDAQLRSAVIEAVQMMGEGMLPAVEALLSDPDDDLRIFCVNILQAVQSRRSPDIALQIALSDNNVNVCAAAVDILAEVGRPEMAAALERVPARFPQHSFLAFAVRAALKRIG